MIKFGELVQNNRLKYVDDSNQAVDYGHYLFTLSIKKTDNLWNKLKNSVKKV
jgi:hypothetical protein